MFIYKTLHLHHSLITKFLRLQVVSYLEQKIQNLTSLFCWIIYQQLWCCLNTQAQLQHITATYWINQKCYQTKFFKAVYQTTSLYCQCIYTIGQLYSYAPCRMSTVIVSVS